MSSEYFLRQIDEARGATHHYTELANKARDKLDLELSRRPEDWGPEVQAKKERLQEEWSYYRRLKSEAVDRWSRLVN
jgi:hypothetical protein